MKKKAVILTVIGFQKYNALLKAQNALRPYVSNQSILNESLNEEGMLINTLVELIPESNARIDSSELTIPEMTPMLLDEFKNNIDVNDEELELMVDIYDLIKVVMIVEPLSLLFDKSFDGTFTRASERLPKKSDLYFCLVVQRNEIERYVLNFDARSKIFTNADNCVELCDIYWLDIK